MDRHELKETDKHFNMGQHYGRGPKGYVRTDNQIQEDVCEALYRDSRIDASNIEVSVKDACVLLKGTVSDRVTKRAAEDLVEDLTGVRDVHNKLTVVPKL